MIVEVFPSGPFETNAYVVTCSDTSCCAIIDPGVDSESAISHYLSDSGLKLEKILLTHSHWDHIGNVAKLKAKYQVPVCIHALDTPNLEQPGTDGLPCWLAIEGVSPDQLLEEGDLVAVGKLQFRVIHTPGHTPGGICFYCEEQQVLFSGDTLFQGAIGNLSFPTANPKLMWESLDKLAVLAPETRVFPGHGPATTIGDEAWLPDAKKIFGNNE